MMKSMASRRAFLTGVAGAGAVALFGCARKPPSLAPAHRDRETGGTTTIVTGLNVPWGIAFLPDGRALVSQRDAGSIVLVDPHTDNVREIGSVRGSVGRPGGEGGLLGLALDPRDRSQLFAYVSTAQDNRVVRIDIGNGRVEETRPILTGIPTGTHHNGGRIVFGPDGHLYVGTGEAGHAQRAQDRDSLGGKILRITRAGKPADGNPFGNEVWSWGHRNVEGLAFDDSGRLWASEFGDHESDELNLIRRGGNYGWPRYEGQSDNPRFVDPKVTWPPAECSPSGMAIARSTAYVAALRGERLWAVPLDGDEVGEPRDYFVGRYGRLRTVAAALDGSLWLTTSNTDGRGKPHAGDDRILRVAFD